MQLVRSELRPPSTLWLLARVAYQRSRSGLMVLSFAATSIQLGLLLHAAVVMTALKLSAKLSTCERAMKAACSADRWAAMYTKPATDGYVPASVITAPP